MRIVVTGASGFIGRGLLAGLSAAGHGGWATGREPPPQVPEGWQSLRRADLLADKVAAAGAEAIVHLEVKHHVPRPQPADVRAFHETNVGGTEEWLRWAGRQGVRRFVHVSSIKAAPPGESREQVAGGTGPADSAPVLPAAPYGRSKALAEAAVRDWAAAAADRAAVILRPAPVYGPGNEANLAAFVRQVSAGRPCLIGAGDAPKSVVSRTNVVAAIA